MENKYFIYFYYGTDNDLLYIGQAIDVGARWIGHTESWKKDVTHIGVCQCPDKASMSFLERYFIAKYPTKYNVAGTRHGYTSFEITNVPKQSIYSLDEFQEKFIPKPTKTPDPIPSVRQRLIEMGNDIIVVDADINLFDDKWRKMDLDRVCFQYQNLYLISKFASIPGRPLKKKEQALSRRTNNVIDSLYKYLNELSPVVKQLDDRMGEVQTITYQGSADDCRHFLTQLAQFNLLYDFFEVKGFGTRDRISSLRNHFVNVLMSSKTERIKDGVFKVDIQWSTIRPRSTLSPHVTPEKYIFSFEDAMSFRCDRKQNSYKENSWL